MMELIIKDNWLTTYTHTDIYMYWYKGMGYTTTGSIHQLFVIHSTGTVNLPCSMFIYL